MPRTALKKAGFQVIAAAAKKTAGCLKAHSVNYRRKGLPFLKVNV